MVAVPITVMQEDSFSETYDALTTEKDILHDWKLNLDWLVARNPKIGAEIADKQGHRLFLLPETVGIKASRIIYHFNDKTNVVSLVVFEFIEESHTDDKVLV